MYDEDVIQEIVDKINIVDYIGQYLELKKKGDEYFCCCPFHDEKTPSFSITPNKKSYYCFGCGEGGNVVTFTQKYEGISFYKAVEKLIDKYGINYNPLKRSNTLNFLRKASKKTQILQPEKHKILNPDILNKFEKKDISLWIEEGIPQKIIDKYGVRYDKNCNRIVYPVYDIIGNLINIKGRTLYEDYKVLGIAKYMNYYKVGDLDYFQGLNLKKDIIKQKKEIIIFEGIKSCMKADSYKYYHSVSAETSCLNIFQIYLLLSLKCDIVIAFDKDKCIDKIVKSVALLKKFTNVYIIIDRHDLLGEKDSPVDQGEGVWNILYSQKERIT